VHKTRRVVFAAAELHDADGTLLAGGRVTNMILKLEN
jgi:acyl-coenzyme A thioesterase PaaI-like protein